jgi:Holliday junction resolvase-like predicted endonuclease
LIEAYNQLFHYELSQIPYSELAVSEKGKAESIAEKYYREKGFQVYRSRVNDGYRCIGVEFYWKEYGDKISESDRKLIQLLKDLLSPQDFKDLAMMVQEKNGTPDLLLIRDNKLSFVEVKCNYETVKSSTVEFFLRYGHKWPISILRIVRSA